MQSTEKKIRNHSNPLKIMYFSQGANLDVFFNLQQKINSQIKTLASYYVTNSDFFATYCQNNPQFTKESHSILKEWEIIKNALFKIPNLDTLKNLEDKYGIPNLWNAIICDRRIFAGKGYAYKEDTKPQFSHTNMLSFLEHTLTQLEKHIVTFSPDLIVSFQSVTIGDYLGYLTANKLNIPFVNLRPTRIKNYIFGGNDLLDPTPEFKSQYSHFLNNPEEMVAFDVDEYIKTMRTGSTAYEGTIAPSAKPPKIVNPRKKRATNKIINFVNFLKKEYSYRFGALRYDNSINGFLIPAVYRKILRPAKAWFHNFFLKNYFVNASDLQKLNFSFFPLHTEPEVAINIYSKPYLNQVEAIKHYALALPVGMKLLVKEHPWSIGKRSLNFYKKVLEIPNVILAHPSLKSVDIIPHAKLITVIAGSIGWEALVLKKPVITLGHVPFNVLPKSMIRNVTNIYELAENVSDLLKNYQNDELALKAYIKAMTSLSVPVDFYEKLLVRSELQNKKNTDHENFKMIRNEHFQRLSQYIMQRYETISGNKLA